MNRLKTLSELALIRAIPDLTIGLQENSRCSGLMRRLQKAVDLDLSKIRKPSKKELNKIWEIVEEFRLSSGWGRKELHTATLVSFCLAMIERSEWRFNRAVIDTLNDIIDHFEHVGNLPGPSCWAGDLAAEKWSDLFC